MQLFSKRSLECYGILTDLPNPLVDIEVQFSPDVERNAIVAATLILHCYKRHANWMALLDRIWDLGRSWINRQIQQSIAALFGSKVLLDFLVCRASSGGHFAQNTHILYETAWSLSQSATTHAGIWGDLLSTNLNINHAISSWLSAG